MLFQVDLIKSSFSIEKNIDVNTRKAASTSNNEWNKILVLSCIICSGNKAIDCLTIAKYNIIINPKTKMNKISGKIILSKDKIDTLSMVKYLPCLRTRFSKK